MEFTYFSHSIKVTAYSPFGSGKSPNILEDSLIVQVSKELSCSPAQVLLAFNTQKGVSVIPKSSNLGRLRENLKPVILSDTQMNLLENHPIRIRYCDSKNWAGIPVFDE